MKPVPVYSKIKQELKDLMDQGMYEAGDKFLTERDVAAKFKTSRITANKVLSALVAEGVLEYRLGVGTFVRAQTIDYDLRSLTSFTAQCHRAGKEPGTDVLEFTSGKATDFAPAVIENLQCGKLDRIYRMVRVRTADGVPVIYEERFLLAGFCPGLKGQDVGGSLFSMLEERFGLSLYGSEQMISAVVADADVAKALGMTPGAAALEVKAVGFIDAETRLWYEITRYHPEHYAFYNWLGPLRRTQPAEGALR
jgi:GntR family transcriptional regulator